MTRFSGFKSIYILTMLICSLAHGATESELAKKSQECMSTLLKSIYSQLVDETDFYDKKCTVETGEIILKRSVYNRFTNCSRWSRPKYEILPDQISITDEDINTLKKELFAGVSLTIRQTRAAYDEWDTFGLYIPLVMWGDSVCRFNLTKDMETSRLSLAINCDGTTIPGTTYSALTLVSPCEDCFPHYEFNVEKAYDSLGERKVDLDKIGKVELEPSTLQKDKVILVNKRTQKETRIQADLGSFRSCLAQMNN